jgi:ABC-type uncharacterized transport system YnjBCD ATPase subunit
MANVSIDTKRQLLVIEMPIQVSGDRVITHPSGTGKSQIVATTSGNLATSCMVNGKPLTLGLNAYIKA